ncbi:hypothetical protein WCT84_06680 [Pectobacterium brasiliense]|uniref:hypothetical protein n=1 Tax=Pectobacterium brasiliense TaxID=180957 RepID=UPI00301A7CC9
MKPVLYWSVKLFQHLPSSLLASGVTKKMLFEGYAKEKPSFRPGAEFTIELMTDPHGLETQTIRTCAVDSVTCTPIYLDLAPLTPTHAEMTEYIKTAIGEGYQPEHLEAVTDLAVIDALSDSNLNREYGKCWQWYNMGGGLHETVENKLSFEDVTKPVIKWLAENVHPHHSVIVDSTHAELLEGQRVLSTKEYLRD